MKKTAEQLGKELENVFSGHPWYGTAINEIIAQATWTTAYIKPPGSVHHIAGIVMHMIGWTEEVVSRLQGNQAADPAWGDWPDAGEASEQNWQQTVNLLKQVTAGLVQMIQTLPDDRWEQAIYNRPGDEPVVTCENLVKGFIQHQVYHAGQIALLNRIHHAD